DAGSHLFKGRLRRSQKQDRSLGMTALLQLIESKHPNPDAAAVYDSLVGIDALKQALVDELIIILDRDRLDAWRKRHHPHGLSVLNGTSRKTPLILLSG